MDRQKRISKKVIIIFSLIIVAFIFIFTAVTLAWFTNTESFNSTIEFGVIEIDTTSGAATQSALTKSVTRNIGSYNVGGNVMPGDTINFNLKIKLTSNSEPAYYLVKVSGTNALSGLNSSSYYYLNDNLESIAISKTATGDSRACGAITSLQTKNLEIPFNVDISLEEQGISGQITCKIAAIQQKNLTNKTAFDELKEILDPTI